MQTFTKPNFDSLKRTCEKIILISDENVDGALMATQLEFLAENIKEFVENPIVKYSGILK
jgi:DNA gyrase/topoisomerase IV subunit B